MDNLKKERNRYFFKCTK